MARYLSDIVLLLCACVAGLVHAQAPSIQDALSGTQNLSSLNTLLTSKLPGILKELGTYDASNPVTFVAPSNAAFLNLPNVAVIGNMFTNNDMAGMTDVMQYHIVEGSWTSSSLNGTFKFPSTTLNDTKVENVSGGQKVGAVLQPGTPPEVVFTSGESTRSVSTTKEIAFPGGVIQMVDAFMIPPQPFVETAENYNLADEPQDMTSFTGAVYSESNNTLATYLNTTQDVTIFVPSNIGIEIVRGSLTPARLNYILPYHVIVSNNGPIYSSSFANDTSFQTLQGAKVHMTFIDNSYFVNSARVLTTDILISNGVVHMIDNVLSPNVTKAIPNPTSYTQSPVLPTTDTGSFNSSAAPFTTFLPGIVSTVTSTATSAASGGMSGTSTPIGSGTGMSSPTSTSKKSDGIRPQAGSSNGLMYAMVMMMWVGGFILMI